MDAAVLYRFLSANPRLLDTIRFDEPRSEASAFHQIKKNHPARCRNVAIISACLRGGKHGVCRQLLPISHGRLAGVELYRYILPLSGLIRMLLVISTTLLENCFQPAGSARRHHFSDPRSSLFLISPFSSKKRECPKGSLSELLKKRQQEVHAVPPSFLQHRQRGFPCCLRAEWQFFVPNQIELLESAFQQQRLLNSCWSVSGSSAKWIHLGRLHHSVICSRTSAGMGYHLLWYNEPVHSANRRKLERHQGTAVKRNDWCLIRRPHLNVRLIKISVCSGKIGSISGSYWYSGNHSYIFFKARHCVFHVCREWRRPWNSIQRHMLKKTKQVHQSLKRKGFTERFSCVFQLKKGGAPPQVFLQTVHQRSNGYTEKPLNPMRRFLHLQHWFNSKRLA